MVGLNPFRWWEQFLDGIRARAKAELIEAGEVNVELTRLDIRWGKNASGGNYVKARFRVIDDAEKFKEVRK